MNGPTSDNRRLFRLYICIGVTFATLGLLSNFIHLAMMTQSSSDETHHFGVPMAEERLKIPVINPERKEDEEYGSEVSVLREIFRRSISSLDACQNMPKRKIPSSGTTSLPEFGIINALSTWLSNESNSKCHLPPSTSCNVAGWSIISTSNKEDLSQFESVLSSFASHPLTREIIFVWNTKPSSLTDTQIFNWNSDSNHPLRIFFSMEHGLHENDALNWYHPALQPQMEALFYLQPNDSELPSPQLATAGFELWKRHSDNGQVSNSVSKIKTHNTEIESWMKHDLQQTIQQLLKREPRQRLQPPPINSFRPVCGKSANVFLQSEFDRFRHFGAHVARPSGTFMHRNFLCFLWHDVFQEVRKFVFETGVGEDVAVSVIITQLTGKSPRTYMRELEGNGVEDGEDLEQKGGGTDGKEQTRNTERKNGNEDMSQITLVNDKTLHIEGSEAANQVVEQPQNKNQGQHNVENKKEKKKKNKMIQKLTKEEEPSGITNPIIDKKLKKKLDKKLKNDKLNNYNKLQTNQQQKAKSEQPHRQLSSNHSQLLQDRRNEAVHSIVNYFGTLDSGSLGYCLGTDYYEQEKNECGDAKLKWETIPWMSEGGLDHDQC